MSDNNFEGVGVPPLDGKESVDVYQGFEDTCGIRSQQLILRDFGQNVLQEDLMQEAMNKGWYRADGDEGTPMSAVGNLLESHGIGVSRYMSATTDDLVNALAQGRKIIVAVDADELWGNEAPDASLGDQTPNHALIVAGIDTSDSGKAMVVLTDPGTGHVAQSYPLDDFRAAWADSGNMMVVTNDPVPNLDHFDYQSGHVLTPVEGQTYSDWLEEHDDCLTNANIVGEASVPGGPIDTWLYDYDGDGTIDNVVHGTDWGSFPAFGMDLDSPWYLASSDQAGETAASDQDNIGDNQEFDA